MQGPCTTSSTSPGTCRSRHGLPGAGRLLLVLLLGASVGGAAACGDDPFNPDWVPVPDTVRLYALSRPELNLPSAYNLADRTPVRVEAPSSSGNWDLALDVVDGDLVFLPPGALGINSRARIAVLEGLEFDDVHEAPSDTAAYVSDRPVAVVSGPVYVVRSGQRPTSFGSSCIFYGKARVLAIDRDVDAVTLIFHINPRCNDPRLVPPGD